MPAFDPDQYAYLDYAATAPLCEEAAEALSAYFVPGALNLSYGGNANSLHTPGRRAFEEMERARKEIASCLNVRRPAEIVFTSGATEADNAALIGMTEAALEQRKTKGKSTAGHVVVSAIEHDAVLAPARKLEAQGVRVTYLAPNSQGFISTDALQSVLCEDTVLVSVMMANSEVGTIQPIKELAFLAHKSGALFHTDATQALGKLPIDVQDLDIDAASFSGHKIGAPKGIGCLYLRMRTPFKAFLLGGGQEEGRRSGTQNVAGIKAFAAACHAVCSMQEEEAARLRELRDYLYERLSSQKRISATVKVEPGSEVFLPNIVHVLVDGLESETLILRLDTRGFGVSGGSACSSHSLDPSHVLKAMGISSDRAYGALRVSMGRYTTREHIERFIPALVDCLKG